VGGGYEYVLGGPLGDLCWVGVWGAWVSVKVIWERGKSPGGQEEQGRGKGEGEKEQRRLDSFRGKSLRRKLQRIKNLSDRGAREVSRTPETRAEVSVWGGCIR